MFLVVLPDSLVPITKRDDPSGSSSTLRLLDIVGPPILSDKKYIVPWPTYKLSQNASGDPKLYGERLVSGFTFPGIQLFNGASANNALLAKFATLAKFAVVAKVASDAVPCNEPVNPAEALTLPVTANEPVIMADPVNGNAASPALGAYEALSACVANEAVPNNDPVNPAVAITLPVICTWEPEAKIKFDRSAPSPVPLPRINADCAEEDILYCPCTCWYDPDATVSNPSACE